MATTRSKFRSREKDTSPPDCHVQWGDYAIKGRIWIEGDKGTFLGYGRVVLLERIGQFGSISKAARSMGMSYRHAWELVASMNKNASSPLVATATGGRGGGGARLTSAGRDAIKFFWHIYGCFQSFMKALNSIQGDLHALPDVDTGK